MMPTLNPMRRLPRWNNRATSRAVARKPTANAQAMHAQIAGALVAVAHLRPVAMVLAVKIFPGKARVVPVAGCRRPKPAIAAPVHRQVMPVTPAHAVPKTAPVAVLRPAVPRGAALKVVARLKIAAPVGRQVMPVAPAHVVPKTAPVAVLKPAVPKGAAPKVVARLKIVARSRSIFVVVVPLVRPRFAPIIPHSARDASLPTPVRHRGGGAIGLPSRHDVASTMPAGNWNATVMQGGVVTSLAVVIVAASSRGMTNVATAGGRRPARVAPGRGVRAGRMTVPIACPPARMATAIVPNVFATGPNRAGGMKKAVRRFRHLRGAAESGAAMASLMTTSRPKWNFLMRSLPRQLNPIRALYQMKPTLPTNTSLSRSDPARWSGS